MAKQLKSSEQRYEAVSTKVLLDKEETAKALVLAAANKVRNQCFLVACFCVSADVFNLLKKFV